MVWVVLLMMIIRAGAFQIQPPTEPCCDQPTLLNLSFPIRVDHISAGGDYIWQTLHLGVATKLLFPPSLHFQPAQPALAEQWNRKRQQKASFDVWTFLHCVSGQNKGWLMWVSALLLFCQIAAGFQLLELPTSADQTITISVVVISTCM